MRDAHYTCASTEERRGPWNWWWVVSTCIIDAHCCSCKNCQIKCHQTLKIYQYQALIRIFNTTRSPECGGMNQIVNCYNKDTKLYWNANYMLKSLDLLSNNLSSLSALIKIRVGQLASRECWGIYTKNWRRRYSHQFWTWPVRYSFFMIYISTAFGFDQYSVWILKIHKLRGQFVNVNVSYGGFLVSNWRFRVFSVRNIPSSVLPQSRNIASKLGAHADRYDRAKKNL